MKVKLTDKERSELLKMWRAGELDLDKLPSLKPHLTRAEPMTNEEARAIIEKLNLIP